MAVPPLFSFLGGSGSGTASGRVLGYSWVLLPLAGIWGGEVRYDALYGVWWLLVRPIGYHPIRLAVMENSNYEFVEVKRFVSFDE